MVKTPELTPNRRVPGERLWKPTEELFCLLIASGRYKNWEVYQKIHIKASKETSRQYASQMMQRPDIKERIREIENEALGPIERVTKDTIFMDREYKREKYKTIVDADKEHTSNKLKAMDQDSKLNKEYESNFDSEALKVLQGMANTFKGLIPSHDIPSLIDGHTVDDFEEA